MGRTGNFSRRTFLQLGAAAAGTSFLYWIGAKYWADRSSLGTFLGSGQFQTRDGKTQSVLTILDLDQIENGPRFIPTDFLPHGICIHPHQRHLVTLFEKKGPGACEVDLRAMTVTRKIETHPDRYFYGHGCFSHDAQQIFSTEAIVNGKEGVVAIRDAQTMKLLDQFPTYGHSPHDCVLIDDGKTLVVTNGGGTKESQLKPSVSYIDVQTRKLLDKAEWIDETVNAGHLVLTHARELIVSSAPRDGADLQLEGGAVSFRLTGKEMVPASAPQPILDQMKSETLSLALHEVKSLVAATNPAGDIITFWDYRKGTFVKDLRIENPRSIALTNDGKFFVVGHGKDASLSMIDAQTLEVVPGSRRTGVGLSGSHLVVWN